MASFQPREPYSDAELKRLYPPHLELQLVQVFLRHGERTPVGARFQNTGLQGFWPYCRSASNLRSVLLDPETGAYTAPEWRRRLETFAGSESGATGSRGRGAPAHDDRPVLAAGPGGEVDNLCDMGALTDLGRRTTHDLGRRLRHLYVDQLSFMPETLPAPESLYLRATPVPRALESLHQTFAGLYPPAARPPGSPPPTIVSRAPQDETLFPNDSNCRRFAALSRAFAQRAADRWNDSPEMALLNRRLGKWMPAESPVVAVDSRPRLSGIMDTINATRAHGRPETLLPREFYDPEVVRVIERIAVEEWYEGYRESNEYRSLGIGSLLGDVVTRMVRSAERGAPAATSPSDIASSSASGPNVDGASLKLGLSGCHDTTLAAVLTSLGAFGTEKWPPFTSHVAIEMFRRADTPPAAAVPSASQSTPDSNNKSSTTSWLASFFSAKAVSTSQPAGIGRKPTDELSPAERQSLGGYYVRVRYNDEPVTIPGCKPQGSHLEGDESFCTLAAFKSIVDKFTPQNWKQQCRVSPAAPLFPEKPEPAGYER